MVAKEHHDKVEGLVVLQLTERAAQALFGMSILQRFCPAIPEGLAAERHAECQNTTQGSKIERPSLQGTQRSDYRRVGTERLIGDRDLLIAVLRRAWAVETDPDSLAGLSYPRGIGIAVERQRFRRSEVIVGSLLEGQPERLLHPVVAYA